MGRVVREQLRGLVVRHAGVDDHVVALLPVDGRRDPVLVAELERVDDTDDLVEVAPGRRRVCDGDTIARPSATRLE